MAEVEKIVLEDKRDNGMTAADVMAIMSGQKQMDPAALMALAQNDNGNNWWWIILLFLFGVFGNFGNRNNGLGNQLNTDNNTNLLMQAIQGNKDAISTLATNLNCDMNRVTDGLCAIRSAVDRIGPEIGWNAEKVINAVAQGNNGILSKMCECCCQTQNAIKDQSILLLNNFNTVNNTLSRGFADLGYLSEKNANAIMLNQDRNTQRILDKMCEDEKQALRDKLFAQNQSTQTLQIIAALSPEKAAAAAAASLK